MKKIILILTLLLSTNLYSQQQVPSTWAFNIANIQGSYFRALLEEANKIQKKYYFVPENKPGAGGNIGAVYVLNQNKLSLLGTALAFFVRPNLYTSSTGYKFDDFKVIHVMAHSPAALVTKDKELQELLKKDKISIGTAGIGSGTHLMALQFKEYFPNKDILLIPYKSSTEALQDVLGGHVDLTFEFLGDAESKNAKILGTTGIQKIKNYPLLKDIGYPNQANMLGVYLILVKSNISDEQIIELRNMFLEAEKSNKVQELYRSDYSTKPEGLKTQSDYVRWYDQMVSYFKDITAGQKID